MIFLHYDHIRPVYYLRHWRFYENARYDLDPKELENAKVFFNALKELPEEDRKILADKYYKAELSCNYDPSRYTYTTVIPINDEVLASKSNMPHSHFSQLRKEAENRLGESMIRILKEQHIKLKTFKLRLSKNLYFVDSIEREMFQKQKYIVGDEYDAKVFHSPEDDIVTRSLMGIGFEKVPAK